MSTFNPDSIQTGDGNIAEPVRVGRQGQQVIFSNVNPAESYAAKYPTLESIPIGFNGTVEVVTPNYRATVKGDGVTKTTTGSSESLADRPEASVLGIGSWFAEGKWFKCDGSEYTADGKLSARKTNGIVLSNFTNGVDDLLTPLDAGVGATIETSPDFGGRGIRVRQASGRLVISRLTFDCRPFLLEANTTINIIAHVKNPGAIAATIYVSTQASNFTGFLNFATNSAIDAKVPANGGQVVLQVTGADLDTTVGGDGSVRIGAYIDRVRLSLNMVQGCEITILGVVINPMSITSIPICFDDCHESAWYEAFTYFSRKGIKGTIAVVSEYVGDTNRFTLDQLKEVYAAGWDVVNHSKTHQGATVSYGKTFGSTGDMDQICENQIVTAGNNFVLNGALFGGGVAFDVPRCIVITCAASQQYNRFQITGLDEHGDVKVVIAYGNAGTSLPEDTTVWAKVTEIKAIDSTVSNTKFGVTLSYDEIYEEVASCKNFLIVNGFTRGLDIFVSPRGNTNILQARVLTALGITKHRLVTGNVDYPFLVPRPLQMPSNGNGIAIGGSAALIAKKNQARDRCGCTSFYLHEFVPNTDTPSITAARLEDFRLFADDLLVDITAGTIVCPTISEHCEMVGY